MGVKEYKEKGRCVKEEKKNGRMRGNEQDAKKEEKVVEESSRWCKVRGKPDG